MAYPLHNAVCAVRRAETVNARRRTGDVAVFIQAVKEMLKAGADVNQRDNHSRTPLDCYCGGYSSTCSEYMLSKTGEAGEFMYTCHTHLQ